MDDTPLYFKELSHDAGTFRNRVNQKLQRGDSDFIDLWLNISFIGAQWSTKKRVIQ